MQMLSGYTRTLGITQLIKFYANSTRLLLHVIPTVWVESKYVHISDGEQPPHPLDLVDAFLQSLQLNKPSKSDDNYERRR